MSPRRALAIVASVAALAACTAEDSADGAASPSAVGDGVVQRIDRARQPPLPQFTGTSLDGRRISLGDYRRRVLVINTWASWCVPCRAEAPALERVWRDNRDRNIGFLGINTRDDADAARAFVARYGVTYPSVNDERGRIAAALKGVLAATALPSTLVVTGDGRVTARAFGAISEPELRRLVEQALHEGQA